MRVAGCTTPAQRTAFEREWTSYCLDGLPDEHEAFLTKLTERRSEGEGVKLAVYVADVNQRLRYWQKYLSQQYPLLARASVRLIVLHVTTCSCERNWSLWGSIYAKARNRLQITRAEKLIYIKCNTSKPSRKCDEEVLLEVLGNESE
jgi:hypothetical protein